VSQQAGSGKAAVNRSTRRRFLQDARAASAAQLRTHRADHFESRRNVFAEVPQHAAAIGTGFLLGRDGLGLARQFGRKRAPCGLALIVQHGCGRLRRQRHGCGLAGFEIFQLQFQLRDIAFELFRARAELHALQLQDEQLETFDLGPARIKFGLFGQYERFERLNVERVEIGE
jgi:hypothetical protein